MRWFFAFFLVSGFCSLVYEVVWLRLAMATFGVTTPLVSLVLAMFMAGLGLGSWGAGQLARRFEARAAAFPLRLYAVTELLIGVSALTVPQQLAWGRRLLQEMGSGLALGSSGYYLVSGGWIALTLLPWCACMGATIPLAMSAIAKSLSAEAERSFSYLYLANVLGAVLGTLVPAFLLIEILGFKGTAYVAATLNAGLVVSALALSLVPGLSAAPAFQTSAARTQKTLYRLPEKGILWLLFGTGLISLAMEVVWIRQFTPYLGNVVYAFATILAVYLTATFVGSRVYRVWIRSRDPGQSGSAWIIVGLLGLIPLASADPRLRSTEGLHLASFLRVAVGVAPFSGVIGFLTPMLVDRWSSGNPQRAGTAYAINILGSILGPLLAGFFLLPWLGERGALLALALPLFAVGWLAAVRPDAVAPPRQHSPRALYAGVALVSMLLVVVAEGFEEQFRPRQVRRDSTATVIAAGEGMQKQLLVNGSGMTVLTPITKMMAHLPLAFLSEPPQSSLVVAFGMGTTFRSLASWGIPSTAVELVPSVPALFGYYHADGPELLQSPRARIVIDDGRRFLERSPEQYDVITVDPPPPVGAASSSLLYSREFYAIVKQRLRPGGIVQQWLPGGDAAVRASVARALQESFPYVRVFQSLEGWGFHFLASRRPIPPTPASVLAGRLPPGAVADLLEWGPRSTAEQQFNDVLSRELPLGTLLAAAPSVPALQDDRPVNEYYFLRHMLGGF